MSDKIKRVSIQEAQQIVRLLIEPSQPIVPWLWGRPGSGKSACVAQVAKSLNIGFVDLRLAYIEPTDLTGLPHINKDTNRTEFAAFDMLPSDPDSQGILFLDELNRAREDTINAVFQLIYDRKVGQYTLPRKWSMVIAGNQGDEDGTMVKEVDAALWSRCLHIMVEPTRKEWGEFIVSRGASVKVFFPQRRETVETGIREDVVDFLGTVTEDKHWNETPKLEPYGNLRTWEKVIQVFERADEFYEPTLDMRFSLAAGIVGIGNAMELRKYLEDNQHKMRPRDILENFPKFKKIIRELSQSRKKDILYTLVDGVAEEVLKLKDPKTCKDPKHPDLLQNHHIDNLIDFLLMVPTDLATKCAQIFMEPKEKDGETPVFDRLVDESGPYYKKFVEHLMAARAHDAKKVLESKDKEKEDKKKK
ncbi:MAG: MoxR family ATPase [bacterium]|nr:MoxR family ATPase [bacterium]